MAASEDFYIKTMLSLDSRNQAGLVVNVGRVFDQKTNTTTLLSKKEPRRPTGKASLLA